ncbi:pentapeptide repeat-containing protein [Streptosporangium sp. NPDC023963]|uniref:pentapeptide repeat-containing protein n=1 Tax=Streptosporangium sp. NPDC023963 TaxID=3155608 RepID=UPI00341D1A04
MRKWPGFPRFVLAILGVVLVAGLTWVLGPGAAWVLEHFDRVHGLAGKDLAAALDAIRGRALTIATGLIALVAVYYTARNAATARRAFELSEQGHRLSEQGQVTDRYTKAIEQLGSDKLDIRLGGIYALERIARDHPTVMEVLAAFVREHSQDVETDEAGDAQPRDPSLRTDLQAAVTVIGRRAVDQDAPGARINFAGAHLNHADFTNANFTDANFNSAHLNHADLTNAKLTRASLNSAQLVNANLAEARLTCADFTDARLRRANLASAELDTADFTRAILILANLTGANLMDANFGHAVLKGANLVDVDLTGATLANATLVDADFTRADLTRTILTSADLTGVVGLPAQ